MKSWLVLLLVGCGSSSSKTMDAASDASGTIDAESDAPLGSNGAHYHYILDEVVFPRNSNDARVDGFDLDGNGTVDNQLGAITSALISQAAFDVQPVEDQALSRGGALMLADLQTTDPTSATSAGYTMYVGTNPNPTPCNGSNDTVCRQHLTGAGMFDVAASPRDPQLPGSIASGVFTGGPGHLSMQLTVAGSSPVQLTLLAAHAQLRVDTVGLSLSKLGGAITESDIVTKIYPAMQMGYAAMIMRDCTQMSPPGCGCTQNSQGASIISFFDSNHDCSVTLGEIENNSLVLSLFQPDVSVEGQTALSAGFAVTATTASFTP